MGGDRAWLRLAVDVERSRGRPLGVGGREVDEESIRERRCPLRGGQFPCQPPHSKHRDQYAWRITRNDRAGKGKREKGKVVSRGRQRREGVGLVGLGGSSRESLPGWFCRRRWAVMGWDGMGERVRSV